MLSKSDSLANLAAALCLAQAEIKGAVKDSTNPFFKNNYADLASVWDACREPLTANGLSVVQFPVSTEGGAGVTTVLLHSSGEWLSETLILSVSKDDAQGMGSAITYARRYALAAVAGVCPQDDDGDGAAQGFQKLRDKGVAILENAAKSGLEALQTAWGTFPNDMRMVCKRDLDRIKGTIRKPEPVGAK